METLDAAKARNALALMVIVISLAEFVLVFLPWVSFPGIYSLSGLETSALGLGDGVKDGYLVAALAAVACLSAILLLLRLALVPIVLVIVTGIATTSVAGYFVSSDWRPLITGLEGDVTWALYSEIGLGVVHALIGGVLASLHIAVRRTRPRLTSTRPSAHTL